MDKIGVNGEIIAFSYLQMNENLYFIIFLFPLFKIFQNLFLQANGLIFYNCVNVMEEELMLTTEESFVCELLLRCAASFSTDVHVRIAGGWVRDKVSSLSTLHTLIFTFFFRLFLIHSAFISLSLLLTSSKLLGVACTDIDVIVEGVDFVVFAKRFKEEIRRAEERKKIEVESEQMIERERKDESSTKRREMKVIAACGEKGKPISLVTVSVKGYELDIMNLRSVGVTLDDTSSHVVTLPSNSRSVSSELLADSFLRDFTINSMFYDVHTKDVDDFAGGKGDIAERRIRCPPLLFRDSLSFESLDVTGIPFKGYLADLKIAFAEVGTSLSPIEKILNFVPPPYLDKPPPEWEALLLSSFARLFEDPLRILRAIRFSLRFQFDICSSICVVTYESKAVRSNLNHRVSRQRITSEVEKLLQIDANSAWQYFILLDLPPVLFPPMDGDAHYVSHRNHVPYLECEDPLWSFSKYAVTRHLLSGLSALIQFCPQVIREIECECGDDMTLPFKCAIILPFLWGKNVTSPSYPLPPKVLTRAYLREKWMWTKKSANLSIDLVEWAREIHDVTHKIHPHFATQPPFPWKHLSEESLSRLILGRILMKAKGMWRVAAELATLMEKFHSESSAETVNAIQILLESRLLRRGPLEQNIYEKEPFWNGHALSRMLDLQGGSQIRFVLDAISDWRILHPEASRDECLQWLKVEVMSNIPIETKPHAK